uniref:Geranylgeranylglycerol-phosphate geranylgeranyltransferase n=1 Tax=Candidatus Kentrum sp. LFY TaxID=2126342 RepID=A0A450WJG0_9GAMM|nr:MAG: geranylgeranylglycerol-phosphate geranylgeranyltransferase [Candidatus Kentron sp. LFY]
MSVRILWTIAQLTRLDGSLLTGMVVFLPLYVNGMELWNSLSLSVPVLFTTMAGFVLNDIHDSERDAINHPRRPIPSGAISKTVAMVIYFALLFLTLLAIKKYVTDKQIFIYLLFAVLMINYNFIVERFAYLKNIYVALTTVVPVCIVFQQEVVEWMIWLFPAAIFFFVLGREMLMDSIDLEGDGITLVKIIGSRIAEVISFSIQFFGSFSLFFIADNAIQAILATLITIVTLGNMVAWKSKGARTVIIRIMKLQFLFGTGFLIT